MSFSKEFYMETWPNGYNYARLIIPALQDFSPIYSVLEIGCGAGGFLKYCNEKNMHIQGVELENIDDCLVISKKRMKYMDASNPMEFVNRKFDLVVSLETAEHIEEEKADTFVNNLVIAGDLILFSAARPGQDGECHINCQDKRYWVEKFNRKGYMYLIGMSNLLRGNVDIPTLFRENSMIFKKVRT